MRLGLGLGSSVNSEAGDFRIIELVTEIIYSLDIEICKEFRQYKAIIIYHKSVGST